jgi:hypothetical protein
MAADPAGSRSGGPEFGVDVEDEAVSDCGVRTHRALVDDRGVFDQQRFEAGVIGEVLDMAQIHGRGGNRRV